MKTSEIVVIGSGPGGSVTAWELIKKNRDVILIESGSYYKLDSCTPYSTDEMKQKYKYGGLNPIITNPKISYVEGECAGGGSEINSGFYHRTPTNILEEWEKRFLIENFSIGNLKSHFEHIENSISVSLLPKNQQAAHASLKLKEGADKLGWESMEVPRWFKHKKDGTGTKQSMTETYLKWYLKAGGQLINDLKAIRISYREQKWTIFCINTKTGERVRINTKFLFLCGGAISTPFIMKSSGLRTMAGHYLQMHPTVKVVAKFNEKINYSEMGVPVHQVKEFSPRISFGCSISSKPHLALALLDNDKYLDLVDNNWENMAIYYAMIKPSSNGKIWKIPFFNDPFIIYRLINSDLNILSEGLTKLCQILFKAGANNIWPSIKDYGALNSSSDIKNIPSYLPRKSTNLMTIHLFSSCPMGENRKFCVANSYGKVFGYSNLYINDGSLLPSAPGVNPQGTIMAIARRNIQNFLDM